MRRRRLTANQREMLELLRRRGYLSAPFYGGAARTADSLIRHGLARRGSVGGPKDNRLALVITDEGRE